MIEIEEKLVCIVGGGRVALRKAKKLLEYGARVMVISPEFDEGFKESEDRISLIRDSYRPEYIEDAFLVIAGTSDSEVNKIISEDCRCKGIMCNVIDNLNSSDFIVPSTVKRGDLVISVSTSGKSPALSKKIRGEIEKVYGEEYTDRVRILGEIREMVLKNSRDIESREEIFKNIVNLDLKELIQWKKNYEEGHE